MKQLESSYKYLEDYLERFPSEHDTLKLPVIIMKIREKLKFKFTSVFTVEGDKLLLETFQGNPGFYYFRKGDKVCGKAWEKSASVIEGNQIAIPIFGDITVKQVFFAEGKVDEEDMHKLESLLSSFSDPGFRKKLERYTLTKDMVYQKMCNVIEFMEQTHRDYLGSFQDFVMVCAFASLAKKPLAKGTNQPGNETELKEELRTLFTDSTFEPYKDDRRWTRMITGDWECKFIYWDGKPEFILCGKSFFSSYSPMRGVLPLKAFGEQFHLLKEWFPEDCTLKEYVDKIRRVHEIMEETVKTQVKSTLDPLGLKYMVALNCLHLDTTPEFIALNVEINSERCLRMPYLTKDKFDFVLPRLPQLINGLKDLPVEEIENRVKSMCGNALPKCSELRHINFIGWHDPVHVTIYQL